MTDLIFYTNPMSRGRIARWMLEEVGQPYETVLLEYDTTMKAPEYLAVNPMGKVPAIRHDGVTVTENAAICAYLADAFPEAGLAPELGARGAYYRWLFFAAGPLDQAVTLRAAKLETRPDQARMFGFGTYDDVITTLDGLLSAQEYVIGDRFSAADVFLGAQIQWGLMFGTIAPRPAFQAYADRLASRPAAIRADEIDGTLHPSK